MVRQRSRAPQRHRACHDPRPRRHYCPRTSAFARAAGRAWPRRPGRSHRHAIRTWTQTQLDRHAESRISTIDCFAWSNRRCSRRLCSMPAGNAWPPRATWACIPPRSARSSTNWASTAARNRIVRALFHTMTCRRESMSIEVFPSVRDLDHRLGFAAGLAGSAEPAPPKAAPIGRCRNLLSPSPSISTAGWERGSTPMRASGCSPSTPSRSWPDTTSGRAATRGSANTSASGCTPRRWPGPTREINACARNSIASPPN